MSSLCPQPTPSSTEMSMQNVAEYVATFQKALEASFKKHKVEFSSTIGEIVREYARALVMQNGLLDASSPEANVQENKAQTSA